MCIVWSVSLPPFGAKISIIRSPLLGQLPSHLRRYVTHTKSHRLKWFSIHMVEVLIQARLERPLQFPKLMCAITFLKIHYLFLFPKKYEWTIPGLEHPSVRLYKSLSAATTHCISWSVTLTLRTMCEDYSRFYCGYQLGLWLEQMILLLSLTQKSPTFDR